MVEIPRTSCLPWTRIFSRRRPSRPRRHKLFLRHQLSSPPSSSGQFHHLNPSIRYWFLSSAPLPTPQSSGSVPQRVTTYAQLSLCVGGHPLRAYKLRTLRGKWQGRKRTCKAVVNAIIRPLNLFSVQKERRNFRCFLEKNKENFCSQTILWKVFHPK